ncbi:family 78 glycoside hydrolase catalytic domain [Parabacteroides pacaensis]|uniref:family 78 glycoside hydrolase catalytic domain n=1 Tax=Parabacteroides pacaensis TaxID=2086575 RepID=UPI000D10EB7E|nr:family 78 glycoside hydrolase catalytic domain [Parabacteroides pacaensis]
MKKIILACLFLGFILWAQAQSLQVVNLTCEYIPNPLGIDTSQPVLAWQLQSPQRNIKQTGYELLVSTSEKDLAAGKNLVWKSLRKKDDQTISVLYKGKKLKPFTRYYWKVRIYDSEGNLSPWSETAWWETSTLQPSDWKAQWIDNATKAPEKEVDFYKDDPAPLFRKTFEIKKTVSAARLYIAGLGYYEANLNGSKIGDRVLDPGWTNYGKQILYSTYDITSMLQQGANAIGVMLGNGFYNPLPIRIFRPLREYLTIGRPCLKAQIRITYTDGSTEIIGSDASWKTGSGAVMRNNVYLGEHYDARKEIKGWDTASFDDRSWQTASPATAPAGQLTAQIQPPIRVTEVIRPVRMTETRPGEFIFDMGQNFAGVARIKVQGPKGTKITIRYGEDVYSDGSLNVMTSVAGQQKRVWDANREAPGQPQTAWQEDSYILKGEGIEEWSPRFTFHGFRYVEITGWPGRPTLENITGLRMNADLPRTGTFECSNPLLNQLNKALDYTFLSNVFSVQSDCPAREKFGYGGDIVGVGRAFCWFYNMENFYRKVIHDFANDQRPSGGMTETAPYNGIADNGLGEDSGPIGWQLAFAYLQKQLYEYYGDARTIEVFYPTLVRQVEFLRSKAVDHIIETCINDHESLEERIPALFATAHYYHHVILLAEFSELLGQKEETRIYSQLAQEIKDAYIRKFVNEETGEVGNHTQGAQAIALYYDLLPPQTKEKAFQVLLRSIREQDGHVAAGIFGVPALLNVLRENNRNDIAYEMVTKRTFPGWGHMLESGATTIWETWKYSDNVYSHNHPMFGSVGEWLYQSVLGIYPLLPGFKQFQVKPQPAGDLTWAKGCYKSLYGNIESSWKKDPDSFTLQVTVPVNTTALIYLPCTPQSTITEGGKEVQVKEYKDGYACIETGSGKYSFCVR